MNNTDFLSGIHHLNVLGYPIKVVDLPSRLCRGPRPSVSTTYRDLEFLIGLSSIIDLEGPQQEIFELESCKTYKISDYFVPMSQVKRPNISDVQVAVATIEKATKPMLVHCHKGKDRTGIVIAAYRVWIQKWSVQTAWDEMMQMGFHRFRYVFWLRDIKDILQHRSDFDYRQLPLAELARQSKKD